ncbi:hypothetical protein GCM10023321_04390 [Pseudonocardia eucalypti]|uniref:Uncharacterized protein n=1 Tax=Pseudonocardia eucalypti TaxID=648755 RepID=A0ABP9PJD1_9PSEU|nr:hypothetical protein [Pseudonocardia eucalypti]
MAGEDADCYEVVTYVDRVVRGCPQPTAVSRVRCHDEPGALYQVVRSLAIASTQPGLYWADWGRRSRLAPADTPSAGEVNRAFLLANGQIVLELGDTSAGGSQRL